MLSLVCVLAATSFEGSHGRIEGDLAVEGGVGVTVGPRAPRATLDLRLRYLSTVGVFGTYEDGLLVDAHAAPKRVLAAGLELRPLFFFRWFQGHETGNPYVDLAIDSIGIELGAAFMEPDGGAFASRRGLQAGAGLEVPLFPHASGLFVGLHGGLRWSEAALSGQVLDGPTDRSAYLTIVLSWQQLFGAHVVDVGDRAP